MERLGRMIRDAETKGPTRFILGVTTSAAVDHRISVQVAGQIIPAVIPGSFRAALAVGQDVRLSVQGSTYTVDSVLSALPTPAVAAPPTVPGINATASSGCYDYAIGDNDWRAVRAYTRDIATSTRGEAGDINELRGDVDALQSAVDGIKTTLAALRSALIAQGHVV